MDARRPRHRRRLLSGALALAALVAAVLPGPQPAAGAAAENRSLSCTHDNVRWRVDFKLWRSNVGPLVRVDALKRIVDGQVTDAATMTWEWRLDAFAYPFRAVRGPLRPAGRAGWQGVEWTSVIRSPRMVTPDGMCQIDLSPFANPRGSAVGRRVAVLGDSLVGSLNDPYYNARHSQGYVEGVFNAHGVLAEVEGQGGRRWTPMGSAALDRADSFLLDEFRGLAPHRVDGVVSALGANDAAALAYFTPRDELAATRDTVHRQLIDVLTEMARRSHCVVAFTTVAHPISVLGVRSEEAYPAEAQAINSIVRFLAGIDRDDALRVYDFAAEAERHQLGSAAPWFIGDNVHLNPVGKLIYTNVIWLAARQCISR